MGAAQGRSTPAAGIEIVYAGLRDRLDALTLPALVIWGQRDRVVSPRYGEQLRDALPDGRLLLLPDAGHVPMCEQPDDVAAAVLELVRSDLTRAPVRAPCELSTIVTMLRKDGKIALLENVPLFSRCSKKQLAAIANLADLIQMPAGTELITEGAPGREFMIIVEGTGEVRRAGPQDRHDRPRRLHRRDRADLGRSAQRHRADRPATRRCSRSPRASSGRCSSRRPRFSAA